MPENIRVERTQLGVRIEKRLAKVLKAIAEYHDMALGDLLEGIVLHSFEGKSPFDAEAQARIKKLMDIYETDYDASASHHLFEEELMTDQMVTRSAALHLNGAPDEVFPLFTARGEYHWIPGWNPVLIYPASGEPLTNGVFATQHDGQAQTLWLTVDYDPAAHHVEYVNVTPGLQCVHLEIQCRPADGGTEAQVTYTQIAIAEAGYAEVERFDRSRLRRAHGSLAARDQLLSGTRRADSNALNQKGRSLDRPSQHSTLSPQHSL